MRWRQLQAFRETMVTGTVSGAAELMGISQPAVSRLIDSLEQTLSITLFDRRSGRLLPTVEAQLFYKEVQKAFSSYDQLSTVAEDIRLGRMGSLHVACLPALGLSFIPDVVVDFSRKQPDVAIRYDLQLSMRVEGWVTSQQVDLGLAEFPCEGFGFDSEDFSVEPYVIAIPEAHPLAKKRIIRPDDLSGVPLVCLGPEAVGRKLLDASLTRHNIRPRVVCETLYASGLCELIDRGLGIGMVDMFTAHDYAEKSIAFRRFEPQIMFHVGLLYPKHQPLSRTASEFLQLLRAKRDLVINDAQKMLDAV
ncbi:LysR substrate-binding domain-containing protein [Halomonas sp. ATCH28]|uniref:LysR substrate-binding domain-containing protein n=1 Tax=Halomonas gemina TaxID=2945105 RepID=A0ABT0T584_9GAMM|nr:LysR substrate-binding domain-containing protein [Halomonas gemina]MCL7941525.1 LysR substrate-binding domain-containing protein [Halomonas gemina]